MTTREEMKLNARAHNRYLTEKYLSKLSDDELLCFVHPLERLDFEKKLEKTARWTGEAPARAHNPDDAGSIPALATKLN